MKSSEKWQIRLKIIEDFNSDLISEKEFERKLLEFDSEYADKEYYEYLLDNIYDRESKMGQYYLQKLNELTKN